MVSVPDIPGHKVSGIVGTGGFASVYRSWQIAVGREVAVKVDNRVLASERDRRRFVREVTAAGRLSGHPHVVDIYDAGILRDGRPYLVMELCPGGSLNDSVRRHGPMSAARVRDIGIRIGDALAAAHAAGVLHRDIKPANILINRYGVVGLSDFGLASIMAVSGEQSATREALTPAYASPETFRAEEPTVAGDIYSLSATLYGLLTGRPPRFPAGPKQPGLATIIALHHRPVDEVPGVSPELMAILRSGLANDPAARPPSAAALRDALIAAPAGSGPQRAPGRPSEPQDQPRQPAGSPRRGRHSADTPAWPAAAGARDGLATGTPDGLAPGSRDGLATGSRDRLATGSRDRLTSGSPDGLTSASRDGLASSRSGAAWSGTAFSGPAPDAPGGRSAAAWAGTTTAPDSRRWPPGTRLIALIAALVVVAGGAALLGARFLAHGARPSPSLPASSPAVQTGSSPGSTPGVFGIPTVKSGCPATSVRSATARCPQSPECWNGLVIISGSVTASSLPCTAPHYWQTFAIGILPADVRTFDQNIVQNNASVRAVCSMRILLRSRLPVVRLIPPRAWEVAVMPPDEAAFDSGARAYRCVAHLLRTRNPRTSQFGP